MSSETEDLRKLIAMDRRSADRLALTVKISYCIANHTDWIDVRSVDDIGSNGVKITTNQCIRKNTEISLKIFFSEGNEPIEVKGDSAWAKRMPLSLGDSGSQEQLYSVGIKFQKMNYKDRQQFMMFISDNILDEFLDNKGNIK